MPGSFKSNAGSGVPRVPRSMPTVRNLQAGGGPFFEYPYALAGVTRDASGAPLGNCIVVVYRSADDSVAARGLSDGSGNYRLDASSELFHYIVAYLEGSPDVAGTTSNELVGA